MKNKNQVIFTGQSREHRVARTHTHTLSLSLSLTHTHTHTHVNTHMGTRGHTHTCEHIINAHPNMEPDHPYTKGKQQNPMDIGDYTTAQLQKLRKQTRNTSRNTQLTTHRRERGRVRVGENQEKYEEASVQYGTRNRNSIARPRPSRTWPTRTTTWPARMLHKTSFSAATCC